MPELIPGPLAAGSVGDQLIPVPAAWGVDDATCSGFAQGPGGSAVIAAGRQRQA